MSARDGDKEACVGGSEEGVGEKEREGERDGQRERERERERNRSWESLMLREEEIS